MESFCILMWFIVLLHVLDLPIGITFDISQQVFFVLCFPMEFSRSLPLKCICTHCIFLENQEDGVFTGRQCWSATHAEGEFSVIFFMLRGKICHHTYVIIPWWLLWHPQDDKCLHLLVTLKVASGLSHPHSPTCWSVTGCGWNWLWHAWPNNLLTQAVMRSWLYSYEAAWLPIQGEIVAEGAWCAKCRTRARKLLPPVLMWFYVDGVSFTFFSLFASI